MIWTHLVKPRTRLTPLNSDEWTKPARLSLVGKGRTPDRPEERGVQPQDKIPKQGHLNKWGEEHPNPVHTNKSDIVIAAKEWQTIKVTHARADQREMELSLKRVHQIRSKTSIKLMDGGITNTKKSISLQQPTTRGIQTDEKHELAIDKKVETTRKTIGIKKTKITHTARQDPTRNQLLQNRKRVQEKTTKYTGQKWRNQRSQSKPKTCASFQSNAEEWPFQSSYEKCWNHESEPQPVKGRSTADETRSRYSPKQEQEILFRNYKKAH